MWEFCRDGALDSALFPVSEAKMRDVIERGCKRLSNPPVVIAIIDGPVRIEASVCLAAATPWYAPEDDEASWVWQDRWIHVHYAHRKSLHLLKLFRFVKWWAAQTKAPVFFGIESVVDVDRKMRVYRRYGQCVGGAFGLNIPANVPNPRGTC